MSETGERTRRKRLTDEERLAKLLAGIKEIKARQAKKDKAKRMDHVQIFALLGAACVHSYVREDKLPATQYLSEGEFLDLRALLQDLYGKDIPKPESLGVDLPEELRFVSFRRRRRGSLPARERELKAQVEQNTVSKT